MMPHSIASSTPDSAVPARDMPWYRHRWPWFLMLGPAIVIVAGFYTLWLAIVSNDGLVADDYYKRGLGINRVLERTQRATVLGLHARVDLDDAEVRVCGWPQRSRTWRQCRPHSAC